MRAKHPHQLTRSDFEFSWELRLAWPAALAVGLLTGYCDAHADTIGLHIYTPHFDRDDNLPSSLRMRNFTPGVYWRGESGATLGVVRNSLARPAVYAAYTWETADGRFALTAGAITGYEYRTVAGPKACGRKRHYADPSECRWRYGNTNAVLRPLIAPSVSFPEAKPYIGATPRVALLGKAVSFAIELDWSL